MNYRVLTEDRVDELHGVVTVYEHVRTGARVMTVHNHDKNKVFMIAFRTTPEDSTGVAHIMEHSVLCGSRKYPIRDPFVELAKGSLNTFLNAMTYPDKTVYPIASVNDQDFKNLMDVYLDSVFYPHVLSEDKIFRQEGWHYEVEGFGTDEEEIVINGVVYNEMKGAFSNPDSVLERFTLNSLFPHTTYAHESGGAPEDIPSLSFEDFKAFHDRFYHPSNSYIYLYGDMDMEERLEYLDREYLSHFERIEIDSGVEAEPVPEAPREHTGYYAISEGEDVAGKTLLSESFCIPGEATRLSAISFSILEYLLLNAPGAILREALIKAGIGEEIDGGYMGELRQPYFSVIARNTDPERAEDFQRVIRDTLAKLSGGGINKKSLRAALNRIEFKCREEDYGPIPMGLAAGLSALGSWIYEGDPLEFLRYADAIEELKDLIDTDYFERLIEDTFLDNDFRVTVSIVPKKGLTEEREEALRARLSAYREGLSHGEIEELLARDEALKAYQNEPDDPEALKCLPVLDISDIENKAEPLLAVRDGDIICSDADVSGIAYIRVLFDTEGLSEEELSLAAFLSDILGEVDTSEHSYQDLSDEIMLHTGGVSFSIAPFAEAAGGYRGYFIASLRVLDERIEKGLSLVAEIINDSVLNDETKLSELLREVRSSQKSSMEGALHKTAVMRASAYLSPMGRYQDLTSGIGFYDFIRGAAHFASDPVHMRRFIRSLKAVAIKLFSPDRLMFSLYGSSEAKETLAGAIEGFKGSLGEGLKRREADLAEDLSRSGSGTKVPVSEARIMNLSCLNEGLKTSSEVSYDAVVGDFRERGLPYRGGLSVLRIMLCYDYLWMRLRVTGGAYGCMALFSMSGLMYMNSYRDPGIAATYRVFEELSDYLRSWDGDDDTVHKYIIGAIAAKDHPQTHSMKAADEFASFIYGMTDELRQRERDEILSCTAEDIRSFAEYIDALIGSGARCTIGNARMIDECASLFSSVRTLF